MADEEKKPRVLPMFLVKPGSMSQGDIERAEAKCGIVVVECEAPESVRLLEPPVDADIDLQARAALSLMRWVSASYSSQTPNFSGAMLIKHFVDILLESSRPESVSKVKKVK